MENPWASAAGWSSYVAPNEVASAVIVARAECGADPRSKERGRRQQIDHDMRGIGELFPTDAAGLTEATRAALLELADGSVVNLRIAPVANRFGETIVRMLAYNGSIPGPALKVRQG